MRRSVFIPFITICCVLACYVDQVSGFQCYKCLMKMDTNKCTEEKETCAAGTVNCQKQYIEASNAGGSVKFVSAGCGTSTPTTDQCQSRGPPEQYTSGKIIECICSSELCNGARTLIGSFPAALTAIAFALLVAFIRT